MSSDQNQNTADKGASAGAPPASAPGVNSSGVGLPLQQSQIAGRKLGQYTILEKIGQGGMGSVFKAFDTALERTVALKVLFSNALDDPKHSERFMREARSLARLSHPNLLHVYNVGSEHDCHYFAMELLAGETLGDQVRRLRRIGVQEVVPYAGQILSALHYVHQQGITHRDIKATNIMICGRRAVLMDFGLARDENFAGMTSIGAVLGTPDYMSPEAAEGLPAGPASDIYSLGVVMYEALTGGLPFTGRSAMSIIRQHMDAAPPRIEAALPGIDPLLASAVHRCLAKKAGERYPDCPTLARDLMRVHFTSELEALADAAPLASAHTSQRPGPPRSSAASLEATMIGTTAAHPTQSGSGDLEGTVVAAAGTLPVDEAALTVEATVVATAAVQERRRNVSTWVWGAIGFFGMLFLIFFVANVVKNRNRRDNAWQGQPVIQRGRDGTGAKFNWIEFHGDDPDPDKWYYEIERQQPDGTWKREKLSHSQMFKSGSSDVLEFEKVK